MRWRSRWSGLPRRGDAPRVGVTALALVCAAGDPAVGLAQCGAAKTPPTPTRSGCCTTASWRRSAPICAPTRAAPATRSAFDSGTKMGELVERDARPILVLTTLERARVHLAGAAARADRRGKVRYAFLDEGCGPHSPPTTPTARRRRAGCAPTARTSPSRPGCRAPGMLWRLPAARHRARSSIASEHRSSHPGSLPVRTARTGAAAHVRGRRGAEGVP